MSSFRVPCLPLLDCSSQAKGPGAGGGFQLCSWDTHGALGQRKRWDIGLSFTSAQAVCYYCRVGLQLHRHNRDFRSSRWRCCRWCQGRPGCLLCRWCSGPCWAGQTRAKQWPSCLPPGPALLSLTSPCLAPRPFLQPGLVSSQFLSTALCPGICWANSHLEQSSSGWSLSTARSLSKTWARHLPYSVLVRSAQNSFSFSPALCPTPPPPPEQTVPRAAKGELGEPHNCVPAVLATREGSSKKVSLTTFLVYSECGVLPHKGFPL